MRELIVFRPVAPSACMVAEAQVPIAAAELMRGGGNTHLDRDAFGACDGQTAFADGTWAGSTCCQQFPARRPVFYSPYFLECLK